MAVKALKYSAPQRNRAYEMAFTLYNAREITRAEFDNRIRKLNKKEKDARAKLKDEKIVKQQERIFTRMAQQQEQFETDLRIAITRNEPLTISLRNTRGFGMSDAELLDYIAKQVRGKYTLKVGNLSYALNDITLSRLRKLAENSLVINEATTESDGALVQNITVIDSITLVPVREAQRRNRVGGGFFKYNHKTSFDLSRYAIYRDNQIKNYDDTCLVVALRNGGCSEEKINQIKHFVKNRMIPKSDIPKICEKVNIQIRLKLPDTRNSSRNWFGTNEEEVYNIGCIDEHYFINEKTKITSYAINNYADVCHLPNFSIIYKKKGNYFERDEKRCIDSFDVITLLLEQKDLLLTEITLEDRFIASTQFYDKINETITHLDYNKDKCVKQVKASQKKNDGSFKNVFFDFETDPNGRHTPYLCRTYDGSSHREFIGEDCGLKMLFSLTQNTRLIAHNCTYDFRFIVQYLQTISEIARGNRLIGASGTFQNYQIEIKDSYHLISMPLRKFSKTFNLPAEKEVMPYKLYNEKNIKKRFVPIKEAFVYIDEKEQEQFLQNIKKWKCDDEDKFDIIKYSSQYCKIDCEILCKGYNIFRGWILKAFQLDIDNILTCASMAHQYFVNAGCYEGVNELGGIPQVFIQGCVVGGRVMTAENKKIFVNDIVNDFDAVSLYPSAMSRMDGFLKGSPKVIKNLSYDWLKNQDGYFVDIKINSVGIYRKFPLMSLKNEDGIRIFSNDMVGKVLRVDKYTLEDYIKYHGITFDVIRGYYFNEGFNKKINDVIRYVFDKRLQEKKSNNPIELVYKLIMNSGYGKSIMKPIETESRFFDVFNGENDFEIFLSRNYNWITSYVKFGNKIKVNLVKTLDDHYNIAQVGVCILSTSKRIMNEVMCLAEDNDIELYYQDTDSMHLKNVDIKKLADVFRTTYSRELIGKGLGQFHSDFDLEGCDNVVATRSIFLGKKCYIDELKGVDADGNAKTGFHIRMKGIPESCIHYVVKHSKNAEGEQRYKNVFQLYEALYSGAEIAFDLTNGGEKANFKFNKDYTIDTLSMFTRTIKFA